MKFGNTTIISYRESYPCTIKGLELIADIDDRGISFLEFRNTLKPSWASLKRNIPGNEDIAVFWLTEHNGLFSFFQIALREYLKTNPSWTKASFMQRMVECKISHYCEKGAI